MKRVFLSYRHADHDWVERIAKDIYEELVLGDLFWDKDPRSLPIGAKWQANVDKAIRESVAMVVAIGPCWLADAGGSRIHQPDDAVHHEISLGLSYNLRMFPVVATQVRARLHEEPLPGDIAELLDYQVIEVSSPPVRGELDALVLELVDVVVPGRRAALKSFTLGRAVSSGQAGDVMATALLAARRDVTDAIAFRTLAACGLARFDYDTALPAATRALQIDPSDPESRHLYGLARLAGRPPCDLSDAEVSSILDVLAPNGQAPDQEPHHRLLLGLVKWDYYEPRGRNTQQADIDFREAVRANEDDPEIAALLRMPSFRGSAGVDRFKEAVSRP